MELAIIVLNWNAAADTIRCVRQIAAWKQIQPTIWIVDNGSADGSAAAIARECPDVRLVRNTTNLGFAGGNNRAITQSLAESDIPILLLNNDASVEEEDVIRLLETLAADEQIGFIGPVLFDAEDETRILSAGGKNPVLHHHTHIYELPTEGPVHTVTYVPGTVIIGRAQVFRAVGLLDEDYFFSTEVADLCMRAAQRGYISVIDGRARAFHTLSRSTSFRDTLYPYYIIRNRFLFIRKFYPKQRILFYGFWTLYSLALSLKVRLSGKPSTARSIWMGLVDGLGGRSGGQNERVLTACAESDLSA
jgi:GT2 family glycosyltransferase